MYIEGLEVVYLAYKPDKKLFCSLERMARQVLLPDLVSVYLTVEDDDPVFTETCIFSASEHNSKGAEDTNAGSIGKNKVRKSFGESEFETKVRDACKGIRKVRVEYVRKSEFGHGRTRQAAMDASEYDRVLLMTQDAVPVNKKLTLELDCALDSDDAAVAFARQKAYPNADSVERLYRQFNYPSASRSKCASDIDKIGIKAFFCSDVCCMYKHELFDRLGGFDTSLNFNEDSIYAYNALKNGFTVEYAAKAMVYHSHNESLKQKFLRSRQLAHSQKENPEVFSHVSSEHEGMKFFTGALKHLVGTGDIKGVIKLISNCAAKYLGYFAGKHF